MKWTVLLFLAAAAGLSGVKAAGVALTAWPWWATASPALAVGGVWGLVLVGTAIHFVTRRLFGFDDSRGVD